MNKKIILIHGLFMHSIVMKFMENKFKKLGYDVFQFNHNSVRYSSETLNNLNNLINEIGSSDIQLVGHSMGGLIARHYIEKFNDDRIKSIVTIGTPHKGSRLGKYLDNSFLKPILGTSGKSGIVDDIKPWNGQVPMGCIAGIAKLGFNTVFKNLHRHDGLNDGTVYLDEAIADNCHDSIIVNCSHTGMVYSSKVIDHCVEFIDTHQFKSLTNTQNPKKNKPSK